MNGKEINLTADNTVITSDNFNVDKKGSVNCKDITIESGNSKLTTSHSIADFVISCNNDNSTMLYLMYNILGINNGSDHIEVACQGAGPGIDVYREGEPGTYIKYNGITTPKVTQTSLESIKKNIEKADINALDIIQNSDIYNYNLKSEEDTAKKHFGFVIGEKYNTPSEVMSEDKQGIDTYSMSSIMWKALQEQQVLIEQLQSEIKELKGENNGQN